MIDILCFCILGEAIRNRTGPGDDKTHENRKKRISFLFLVFQQKWCFNLRLFQIFMLMSPRNLFLVFVSFPVAMHFRLLLVTVVIHLKVNESSCDSFLKSKWKLRPLIVASISFRGFLVEGLENWGSPSLVENLRVFHNTFRYRYS